jgi:hypothetical protein
VVLALPALDAMTDRKRSGPLRATVGLVLAVSVAAQVPGVLVNFEAQEALDMKAGATFDDLVWKWRLSPLLTYWQDIGASAWEPLLTQPFFRMQRGAMAVITGLLLTAVFSISRSWSWAERGRLYGSRLVTLGIVLIALPTTMIMRSGQDPRWEDRSANLADNQQVASTLNAVARGDMVIFDLEEGRAIQSRAWWRANTMPAPALFVGWLRKEVLSAEDDAFLQRTVQKRLRTWLVLQETVEGDPASTTERWLDANAYRGRSEWTGAQRIVEYVGPELEVVALGSPVSFGYVELQQFRVLQGDSADEWGVELTWTPPYSSDLRFSLQGLDEAGSVVAQVDRAPGSLDGAHDRIGLSAPGAQRLVLKLYRASDGAVLPVAGSDSLTLWPAGQ